MRLPTFKHKEKAYRHWGKNKSLTQRLKNSRNVQTSDTGMKIHNWYSPTWWRIQKVLEHIQEQCPLIVSAIESLVVTDNTNWNAIKTEHYKKLCASQFLAVLLNIRNSRAVNDFVFLFGILCISFGAGKQMINMLSKLGLSVQWDTL